MRSHLVCPQDPQPDFPHRRVNVHLPLPPADFTEPRHNLLYDFRFDFMVVFEG